MEKLASEHGVRTASIILGPARAPDLLSWLFTTFDLGQKFQASSLHVCIYRASLALTHLGFEFYDHGRPRPAIGQSLA
jgi:hypothetical protein